MYLWVLMDSEVQVDAARDFLSLVVKVAIDQLAGRQDELFLESLSAKTFDVVHLPQHRYWC